MLQRKTHHIFVSGETLQNEELLFSILSYCDEKTRNQCIFLSKQHAKLLTSETAFKWRCQQLHREHGVYHSPTLPPPTGSVKQELNESLLLSDSPPKAATPTSWKQQYFTNKKCKYIWMNKRKHEQNASSIHGNNSMNLEEEKENFNIQVCARFKPKKITAKHIKNRDKNANRSYKKKVTLPLHQRLALIRMNRNLPSNKHALQVLQSQGDWFAGGNPLFELHEESKNADNTLEDQANHQRKDNNQHCRHVEPSLSENVQFIDTKNNSAIIVDRVKGLRKFHFDHVMNDYVSQQHVYECSTMPLVTDFINGCNATCIVYGQTGSGKTHTMFGPHDSNNGHGPFLFPKVANSITESNLPDSWGIIPRACAQIFDALDFRSNKNGNGTKNLNLNIESQLSVSYIEIYGNDVNDLLRDGIPCGHSKVSAQRYVLDGSSEITVDSLPATLELLNCGEKQKRVASTGMNDRSSRAHTLFILTLRQKCYLLGSSADKDTDNIVKKSTNIIEKTSRFILADLGGSEQLKKSQPCVSMDNSNNTTITAVSTDDYARDRLRETVNINLGLLALKQCVKALRSKRKSTAVPYADSKLTMLLSSGLGRGKEYSKTSIIICSSQHEDHVNETIDAMKFGHICKGIHLTTITKRTNQMLQELLSNINDRIQECEENIRKHERWETRPRHYYDDNGIVIDTKQTTVIVGAEQYRQQLAQFLKQKMELTGDKAYSSIYYNDDKINRNQSSSNEKEDLNSLSTPSYPIGFGNMDAYTGIG